MTNCYVYIRVSGNSQVEQDGPERQRVACQEYAQANGLEIAGEYFEKGVSGKSELSERPALGEMLVAMEVAGVKVVLIEKLDRVARDLMVQETIMGDLRRRGVKLLSTAEPDLCSDEPSRVLIRQIFGALAQWERACICLKLKSARDRIKANGRHPGQKGYSTDPVLNKLADGRRPYGLKPGEGETLELMRGWRGLNATYSEIAAKLNWHSIPSRSGKPWKTGTVAKILSR